MAEAIGRAAAQPGAAAAVAAHLSAHWPAVLRITSAALIGFGVILFVAANWDHFGRFARFGLVGGAFAAAALASLAPRLRVPGLLAAFLAAGGLLALIGQTYQSGADEWQLFALWAALALPFALAARHDALWTCWALVFMTTLALLQAQSLFQLGRPADHQALMVAWAFAVLAVVLLSPWSPVAAWTGLTKWAFRLVVLLAATLIVRDAARELFIASDYRVYLTGLLVLLLLIVLLAVMEPLDLALIGATALAADVLAILGLIHIVLDRPGADMMGSVLVIGIASAGLVAATGAGLLKLARSQEHPHGLPVWQGAWPVTLVTGLGALLAAIPLLAGLALAFYGLLVGPATWVLAFIVLAGAAALIRSSQPSHFMHMFGIVGLVAGLALAGFVVTRDTSTSLIVVAPAMIGIVMGLAVAIGRTWVQALLGAVAAALLALWVPTLIFLFMGLGTKTMGFHFGWGPVLVLMCLLRLAAALSDAEGLQKLRSPSVELFLSGALAASLLGVVLWSGPTLLVGAQMHWDGQWSDASVRSGWSGLSIVSLLIVAGSAVVLQRRRPELGTSLGLATLGVLAVMSAFVPGLAFMVLLGVVALVDDSRRWLVAAAIGAIWLIGAFYYAVDWPLLTKAALMTAIGIAFGALAWVTRSPAQAIERISPPIAGSWVAPGLVVLGMLAVTVTAAQGIAEREKLIANGHKIYVALAPRDPRSLMQGDYMTLTFALPTDAQPPDTSQIFWAIARVDQRSVATVERIVSQMPSLEPETIVLPLRVKSRRWVLVTDAWYFREGTAQTWNKARFGEFRVSATGQALLVGLADESLALLIPGPKN